MLLLPRVVVGPVAFALPVSDRSVLCEGRLLLAAGDGADASLMEQLAERIALDPPFYLGLAFGVAAGNRTGRLPSSRALATCRATQAADLCRFFSEDFSPGMLRRMEFLVRESLFHAHLTRCVAVAAGASEAVVEQAYAIGLGATAREWLDLMAPATPLRLRQQAVAALLNDMSDEVRGHRFRAEGLVREAKSEDPSVRRARLWAAQQTSEWTESLDGVALLPSFARRLNYQKNGCSTEQFERRLEEEKLASLGEFAAGIGHDFNNPLAIIRGRAELLLRGETDRLKRRDLAVIIAQAVRAFEMIADLRLCSRPPEINRTDVDFRALLEEVAEVWREKVRDREIVVHCAPAHGPLVLEADPIQMRTLLDALCKNSVEAIDARGTIRLSADWRVRPETDAGPPPRQRQEKLPRWLEIQVADDGPGIRPEHRRHIFDPFFSSREAGRGLGFGLPKARRIVLDHGGTIEVDGRPGRGAVFTVRVPETQPSPSADAPPA